jgi:uncharacterized protein DUF5989
MSEQRLTEFEQIAEKGTQDNVFTDFWFLFRYSKKYWLLPVVLVLILLGGLMLLSGTAVAPFIYTLF